MAKFRVIVVDQNTAIRDMINDALIKLAHEFNLVYVQSGEEAQLEIRAQNFDLLISSLALNDMNGFDLVSELKAKHPDMKMILISDDSIDQFDPNTVDELVDFVYREPVDQADLQNAVGKCLGVIESRIQENKSEVTTEPRWNLSERLTSLRQELGAITSLLLDENGTVLARSGELPDVWVESSLFPSVMASYNASCKVARFLHSVPPRDFWHISGKDYDLILSHVSDKISLVEMVNPVDVETSLSDLIRIVRMGVSDIYEILLNIGIDLDVEEVLEADESLVVEEDLEAEAPRINEIFQSIEANIPVAEEVDAFWNTFADQEMSDGTQNPDVLTYEQAIKLGLAPRDR